MTTGYRIVFHGLTGDSETFENRMAQLGVPSETVGKMIEMAPVILKGDLSFEGTTRYVEAVQGAGGKVTIQKQKDVKSSSPGTHSISVPPFEDFTMCPECGFKQPKAESCAKCGFGLDKEIKEHTRKNASNY